MGAVKELLRGSLALEIAKDYHAMVQAFAEADREALPWVPGDEYWPVDWNSRHERVCRLDAFERARQNGVSRMEVERAISMTGPPPEAEP